MKANELRLGNYINVPNTKQCPFRIDAFEHCDEKFIKVAQEVKINGTEVHPLTWYGKDLEPIPLTEEWLLKFGFEKIEDFGVYSNIWHFKGFMVSLGNYINVHVDWADDGVGFHSIRCYEELFIHQLQNLYFALIGEELTILS